MAIPASDVIPTSCQRANVSDNHPELGRESIHLLLIDEASKGLDDVAAGRTQDARAALTAINKHRAQGSGFKRL